MIGHPRFKYKDNVTFTYNNQIKVGKIYIIDAYGTFSNPSDVSYDIFVESENMLYKHITEERIEKIE